MAESASYWVCRCGTANLRSARRCKSCGRRHPVSWKLWAALGAGALVLAGLFVPRVEDEPAAPILPPEQQLYAAVLSDAAAAALSSPNELAFTEILRSRDRRVISEATKGGHISNWQGAIEGIAQMSNGAGLSIRVDASELVAGVYLFKGLDTLIHPGDDIYQELLGLREGDRVVFSGQFLIEAGHALDLRYAPGSTPGAPRYLFEFSALKAEE